MHYYKCLVCSNPLWIKVGSKSAKNWVLWVQLLPIAIIIRNIQFSPSIVLTLVLLKLLRPIQYLYLGKLDSPGMVAYLYSWYYAYYICIRFPVLLIMKSYNFAYFKAQSQAVCSGLLALQLETVDKNPRKTPD